jgi:hypothetical protein
MSRQLTDNDNGFAARVTAMYSAQGVGPIPFEDVLDRLRPQTDDELAEVIKADAAEMIVRSQPVTVFRYSPFVAGRPSAYDAAVEACAGSHYELEEMSWEEAQRVARNEAAEHGRSSARRPLPRRRRRLLGGTVAVPVPVVTIIVVVAVLAMGWMGQSLYAANLKYERAQAAAEAEYERGEREAATRLQAKQLEMMETEHELRIRLEEANNLLEEAVESGLRDTDKEMAAGRYSTALEIGVGIERIVIAAQKEMPTLPYDYSKMRIDTLIMPMLETVYEHVDSGVRQGALAEVRKQLERLENTWLIDIRSEQGADSE